MLMRRQQALVLAGARVENASVEDASVAGSRVESVSGAGAVVLQALV
jgi:hypothetical protein